jgi:hypothetical protein
MAQDQSAPDLAEKGWQDDASRDIATYRLLSLGKALVQHTGQQEHIAEQIARHGDLLGDVAKAGFDGLTAQAIIETEPDGLLYLGRQGESRADYLLYCRTAAFEAAIGYGMRHADRDIAHGEVHSFKGDPEAAADWTNDLTQRIERGDFRRAEAPEDRSPRLSHIGTPLNNRHRYRRSSVFCAAKMLFDDREIDCDILNVSAGGAQIRVHGDEEPPTDFLLRIEGFGEFQAETVRRAGDKYGVAFKEEPDEVERVVDDIISHPERTNDIRRYPRRMVLLSGALYVDNRPVECRVLDVSAGGARLRVDQDFEHESRMPLMIYRFGEFPTEVVWQQDTDLGVTFIEDPDEIERIIGHILPKKGEANR